MKSEVLVSPFTWEERRVAIHDRVWYIPSYYYDYESFTFPGWSHPDVFTVERPIIVEYCSGNGAWIAAKAAANPHLNWVAVEKKFERVRKIWNKIKSLQLDNLIVVCGEAYKTTHCYFPASSVSEIYINFPDPWPKQRHAKNRLIQPLFLEQLERILQPNGKVIFVTDDPTYSQHTIETFNKYPGFQSSFPDPYFVNDWPDYGTSFFEELWRGKGMQIRYHQFQKSALT